MRLPAAWSNLTSLESLNIYGNQLEGAIPASWSSLSRLESLILSENKLSGELPAGLSELKSLRHFNIGRNAITGGLEHLLLIPTLSELNAAENMISCSLSFLLKDVGTSLTSFGLSSNRLDRYVSPSDFAVGNASRSESLFIDLRYIDFSCPFPASPDIRRASKSGDSSRVFVSHDLCSTDYGSFLLKYGLPSLGAVVAIYVAWKLW